MRQHCKKAFISVFAAGGLWVSMSSGAVGQVIASDNAGNPPYADGWQNNSNNDDPDNGGFGFGPWDGGYGAPNEIDTTPSEPDNQLGAPAFRYGPGSGTGGVGRTFAQPMQAGQSFQMDIDPFPFLAINTPDVYSRNEHFFGLGDRFSMYAYHEFETSPSGTPFYQFGSTEWGLFVGSAFDNFNGGAALPTSFYGSRLIGFSVQESQGITINVELPTIDTYRLRIYDLSDVLQVDVSGNLGGTTGGTISSMILDSRGGWNRNTPTVLPSVYFNNLQILEAAPPEGLDGDYNDDGVVDGADYVMWRKLLPSGGTLQNDNTPGADSGDYAIWVQNFGDSQSGSGGTAVPEPASLVCMLCCAAALVWRRRSR